MVKAKRAEGRRVETEDTRSAEETIDGSESDVVEEKDPSVGPTIAALGWWFSLCVGVGGCGGVHCFLGFCREDGSEDEEEGRGENGFGFGRDAV
ncbi:hypothetical protein FCV25MIE_17395, partial [Fagus crenata]